MYQQQKKVAESCNKTIYYVAAFLSLRLSFKVWKLRDCETHFEVDICVDFFFSLLLAKTKIPGNRSVTTREIRLKRVCVMFDGNKLTHV